MAQSTISRVFAAALLCSMPLSAFAVVGISTGPVCLAGVVRPGQPISDALIKAVNSKGAAGLPAVVAELIRAGQNPASVVQAAVAYGGNPQAVVNAAMATGIPKDWNAIRIAAIACGADPTALTEPAGFGGVGFPGSAGMPQSEGGDQSPVSPS